MAHIDLHLATIQGAYVYVCCQFSSSRWGVTQFHQKLGYVLVVPSLSILKIIGICDSMMTSSGEPNVIMTSS